MCLFAKNAVFALRGYLRQVNRHTICHVFLGHLNYGAYVAVSQMVMPCFNVGSMGCVEGGGSRGGMGV